MLEIVDAGNRHLYKDALEDMYRMRYRAAVEEMGWSLRCALNRYDKDEFDYDDTVYLIHFNDDGTVGACGRINPTTRPHLLSDVFPQMCVEGVPQGPKIYEYSRGLIERRGKSNRDYMRTWLSITQGVNEWAIDNGVDYISWLTLKRLYGLSAMLWETRPLGPAVFYEDDKTEYIAGLSRMDAEGLKKVEAYTKSASPITQYKREVTKKLLVGAIG